MSDKVKTGVEIYTDCPIEPSKDVSPEVEKYFEDLIKNLDMKELLTNLFEKLQEQSDLENCFPFIYLPGEEPPKRYGYSGEEI